MTAAERQAARERLAAYAAMLREDFNALAEMRCQRDESNRIAAELKAALNGHIRFHKSLAVECELAGTDFARGRACGITELAKDIESAMKAAE